jgi:hypothetical protein
LRYARDPVKRSRLVSLAALGGAAMARGASCEFEPLPCTACGGGPSGPFRPSAEIDVRRDDHRVELGS